MAQTTEQRVIGCVDKNASEEIRVDRGLFNGRDVLGVRVWTKPVVGGEAKPTPKGITCRVETWQELLPLIEQAVQAAPADASGAD